MTSLIDERDREVQNIVTSINELAQVGGYRRGGLCKWLVQVGGVMRSNKLAQVSGTGRMQGWDGSLVECGLRRHSTCASGACSAMTAAGTHGRCLGVGRWCKLVPRGANALQRVRPLAPGLIVYVALSRSHAPCRS